MFARQAATSLRSGKLGRKRTEIPLKTSERRRRKRPRVVTWRTRTNLRTFLRKIDRRGTRRRGVFCETVSEKSGIPIETEPHHFQKEVQTFLKKNKIRSE